MPGVDPVEDLSDFIQLLNDGLSNSSSNGGAAASGVPADHADHTGNLDEEC